MRTLGYLSITAVINEFRGFKASMIVEIELRKYTNKSLLPKTISL